MRTITDSSGAVVGASTFDSFGARTAHTGTADSLFGFTGNWTDPATGFVYLRARDYDPVTGQFLSVDPAVDSTLQPYAYAGNDPVSLTDSSGLDWWSDALNAVGKGLEAAGRALNCFGEQAAAFGLGGLDSLTGGLSSMVLGAMVPGYNDFVAGHQAAFDAGSLVATVTQVAFAIATGVGVVAGLAAIAIKAAVKAGLKEGIKAVVGAIARTFRRLVTDETGEIAFGAASRGARDALLNDTILVRGGLNTAEHFAEGSGVTIDSEGTLQGVSVNSGNSVEEAASGLRNGQVYTATVGSILDAGGTVVRAPTAANLGHCLIGGCSAETFVDLFTQMLNPAK